jgi:hypothetical protein
MERAEAALPRPTARANEHSEQARAPHTNKPRDVPPVWGSEFTSKFKRRFTSRGGGDSGAQQIVRGGARCASQVLHHCDQAASRGGMRPSRLFFALRRNSTSASLRSCGIYRHERRATKRGRRSKSKRRERAQRNMRAHPGKARIVELASLRGAPSRAVRLVGLAGEVCIKLALHLLRLALLRGRFFERRSRCSFFWPSARLLSIRARPCLLTPLRPCAWLLPLRGCPCPLAPLKSSAWLLLLRAWPCLLAPLQPCARLLLLRA